MAADMALRPPMAAPQAARKAHSAVYHGLRLEDPYAWLRDPNYPEVGDPEVLDYLKAENAYFEAAMAPYKRLQDRLFEEMKGRLKDDDSSVPAKNGNYLYQWRFEKGAEYRRWGRMPVVGGAETLLIDEAARAQGHDFYSLRGMAVSPDDRLLAFSEDNDGSERATIRLKEIAADRLHDLEIANTSGAIVWAADSRSFLYVELSPQLRPFRVKLHRLGGDPKDDKLVYEEKDESYFVGIGRTQSRAFLLINAGDHVTSEVRLLPADDPAAAPKVIAARLPGREYDVDHAAGKLFIRVNDTHKNFRLVSADPETPEPENWRELIAGSDERYIHGVTSFKSFLAVEERINGLDQILISPHEGEAHYVKLPEAAYSVGLGANADYDVAHLRLSYESMVTPATVYDYDLEKRTLVTRKVQEIPSGYDAGRYVTERLMARARDGVMVPISIVYKKGFKRNGAAPLHLYAYGAYGHGMTPYFSTARISLLDRGFAYAIAHIRGGDEMGYGWYEDGKLFRRWNTFTDFVDCARHLTAEGYAGKGGISISGGSAGGELMGVAANIAPELWRAVVAHVPFVDVLNTMLDASLPLTPIEWPEWGNPIEDPAAFAYIRSYSPYDNVAEKAYPPILITGGLNDPRVTYWEPAKWAAKLRAAKTDDNLLLLKTNMGAGHAGKSGRYVRLEETAEEFCFILMAFGRTE